VAGPLPLVFEKICQQRCRLGFIEPANDFGYADDAATFK